MERGTFSDPKCYCCNREHNPMKFSATKIDDLFTAERDAGRRARMVEYIVAAEASDGSWCEFDGLDYFHAKTLADNAVDKLGCRGASVWHTCWRTGEKLSCAPLYRVHPEETV